MKRPSASARDGDDRRGRAPCPSRQSVRRAACGASSALQAAGDRLDRRQRVVDLVAEHAHQPLPRLALLLAQRLAEVGQHQQLVRQRRPAGTCRAAHLPAARRRPGNVSVAAARDARRSRRSPSPSSCGRRARAEPLGRLSEQPLAARLTSRSRLRSSKAKTATSISAITVRSSAVASSAPSRCARSVSASALTSSSTAPSASSATPRARADREVALAQRGEQVGERLQRPDHPLAQRARDSPATAQHHHRQRRRGRRRRSRPPQRHAGDDDCGSRRP